jgi:hypothetical protein
MFLSLGSVVRTRSPSLVELRLIAAKGRCLLRTVNHLLMETRARAARTTVFVVYLWSAKHNNVSTFSSPWAWRFDVQMNLLLLPFQNHFRRDTYKETFTTTHMSQPHGHPLPCYISCIKLYPAPRNDLLTHCCHSSRLCTCLNVHLSRTTALAIY